MFSAIIFICMDSDDTVFNFHFIDFFQPLIMSIFLFLPFLFENHQLNIK